MQKPTGTLYILSAASGTGKTSLSKGLVASLDNIKISISHTTRPIRAGEQADQSYFFIDEPTFIDMIEKNAFLEHAKVFGYYYGTSHQWVNEQLQNGIDVILDIDWQGAQIIRKQMSCISIFLLPPSREALRERLMNRKREDANIIEDRLVAASSEIAHYHEFDYIIVNDKFELALDELRTIVKAQRLHFTAQAQRNKKLIENLL